jgi:hypothetical protein
MTTAPWHAAVDDMLDAIFEEFAQPVTLDDAPARAVIRSRLVEERESTISGLRVTAKFLRAETPDLHRGMALTVGARHYRLDAPMEATNDGRISLWVLRND